MHERRMSERRDQWLTRPSLNPVLIFDQTLYSKATGIESIFLISEGGNR